MVLGVIGGDEQPAVPVPFPRRADQALSRIAGPKPARRRVEPVAEGSGSRPNPRSRAQPYRSAKVPYRQPAGVGAAPPVFFR